MKYTEKTNANIAAAVEMRQRGKLLREIAEELGVSKERARQYLHYHKIKADNAI
jgi:orotate phosphoribosyltransferase-like protein